MYTCADSRYSSNAIGRYVSGVHWQGDAAAMSENVRVGIRIIDGQR